MMPLKKRHREVPLPSPPGASSTPPSVDVDLSLDRTKPIDLTTTPPAATATTVLDDYADEGPSDGPADDGGAKRQQQQHLSDDPSRPEAYEVRYPHVPPEELLCDSETGKWIVTSMTRDRKRKVGTIEVCMDASGTGRAWFCDAATHQHIKYRLVPDPEWSASVAQPAPLVILDPSYATNDKLWRVARYGDDGFAWSACCRRRHDETLGWYSEWGSNDPDFKGVMLWTKTLPRGASTGRRKHGRGGGRR